MAVGVPTRLNGLAITLERTAAVAIPVRMVDPVMPRMHVRTRHIPMHVAEVALAVAMTHLGCMEIPLMGMR